MIKYESHSDETAVWLLLTDGLPLPPKELVFLAL